MMVESCRVYTTSATLWARLRSAIFHERNWGFLPEPPPKTYVRPAFHSSTWHLFQHQPVIGQSGFNGHPYFSCHEHANQSCFEPNLWIFHHIGRVTPLSAPLFFWAGNHYGACTGERLDKLPRRISMERDVGLELLVCLRLELFQAQFKRDQKVIGGHSKVLPFKGLPLVRTGVFLKEYHQVITCSLEHVH